MKRINLTTRDQAASLHKLCETLIFLGNASEQSVYWIVDTETGAKSAPLFIPFVSSTSLTHALSGIIALWGWFSRDVLAVTCCEHGPPSIATVLFSKLSIASKYYLVKQIFRFLWQLFICASWQPVYSNNVISLAIMKWAKYCLLLGTKIHISVNKTRKKINQ